MKLLSIMLVMSAVACAAAWGRGLDIIGFPHRSLLRVRPVDDVSKHLEPIVSLDLVENETAFSVHADLPGVSKDEVEVNIDDGVLTISAHKENHYEESTDTVHHMERSYGTYERSIRLPKNVKVSEVSATVEDGVLEVTLPKDTEHPVTDAVKVPIVERSE